MQRSSLGGAVLCLTLCGAAAAHAQTIVQLRYGGPGTRIDISSVTQTNPIQITTKTPHGFTPGQTIYVQGVAGVLAANGSRKVYSVASSTTFTLADANGTTVDGSGAAPYVQNSGVVGQTRATQILAHPRMWVDANVLASIQSPARNSQGWVPYDQVSLVDSFVAQPDAHYDNAYVNQGYAPISAALKWLADPAKTQHRDAALHWLNNVEKYLIQRTFSAFNEASTLQGGGISAFTDAINYGNFAAGNAAIAYSLVRSEMTPQERQAFAAKILNGVMQDPVTPRGCVNLYEDMTGTISAPRGSKTVTGTGTAFTTQVTPGQWIGVYGAASARQVASVESDTQLTLTAAFSTSADYNDVWGRVNAWTAPSCGMLWYGSHHAYVPGVTAWGRRVYNTAAMDATQTTVVIGDPSVPFLPIYAQIEGEWLKVTAVDIPTKTWTVERGQFRTAPASHLANRAVFATSHPRTGKSTTCCTAAPTYQGGNLLWNEDIHNLIVFRLAGLIPAGLALADDDERARALFEESWNYLYDHIYYDAAIRWTGLTQGNTISYGYNTWYRSMMSFAIMGRTSLSPASDMADGEWLKSSVELPIRNWWTATRQKQIAISETSLDPDMQGKEWSFAYALEYLYPGWNMLPAIRDFLRNKTAYWTTGSYGLYYYGGWWAYLYIDPSMPTTDADSLPKWHFGTQSDYAPPQAPHYRNHYLVSRSSWAGNSTVVFNYCGAWTSTAEDHSPYPYCGNYIIAKGSNVLLANGGYKSFGGNTYNRIAGLQGTVIGSDNAVRNLLNTYSKSGTKGIYGIPLRQKGTDRFTYWALDNTDNHEGTDPVSASQRQLAHLTEGVQDYVVVYDRLVLKSSQNMTHHLQYNFDLSAGSTSAEFEQTGGDIRFIKGGQEGILTRILMPSTVTNTQNLNGVTPISYTVKATETGTTGEFLVVHRPTSNLTSPMPPITLLTSTAGTRAVQIDDETKPKIVVFKQDASTGSALVSFQAAAFAGDARILITGLSGSESARYRVSRDGVTIADEIAVATDGVLELEASFGSAGSFEVMRTDVPPPLEIVTSSLPGGLTGYYYSQAVSAIGGTPPYAWQAPAGEMTACPTMTNGLCFNRATGTVEGTPVSAAAPYDVMSFTVSLQDSESNADSQDLTISITAAPIPLSITTATLPAAVLPHAYSHPLAASGGATPYTWSVVAGTMSLCPALSNGVCLNAATGTISGTPENTGTMSFTVRVQDQSSATADRSLSLEVLPPIPPPELAGPGLTELGIGRAASVAFTISGGVAPYTCDLADGALPEGLSLETMAAGCRVHGSAAGLGDHAFTLRAADSAVPSGTSVLPVLIRVTAMDSTLEVASLAVGAGGAWFKVRNQGQDANQICKYVVYQAGGAEASRGDIPNGPSTRHLTVPLVAGQNYAVHVACGTRNAAFPVAPQEASGTQLGEIRVRLGPPLAPGATQVRVHYSVEGEAGNSGSVTAGCAAGCEVRIPPQKTGSLVVMQHEWLSSTDAVVAVGGRHAAVAR